MSTRNLSTGTNKVFVNSCGDFGSGFAGLGPMSGDDNESILAHRAIRRLLLRHKAQILPIFPDISNCSIDFVSYP